jgi:DNA-directed RNA polymerase specialized sigma24 family protein
MHATQDQTLLAPFLRGIRSWDDLTFALPRRGDLLSQEGSVSRWLGPLQDGDPAAVQHLWQRYFLSLVQLACKRLRKALPRGADAEDVALSAFDSFCRNAEGGRFPQLSDRNDLWRLLAVITARKASHLLRDESRQKRGGPDPTCNSDHEALLEQVFSREPSPELAVQMTEEYERLLNRLGDDQLRQVAVWRMEGHTVEEIAVKVGCAPRSVKRKLQLIRSLWQQDEVPQ